MLDLSHKKLDVYVESLRLVNEVYDITKNFPKEELYGLVSQLRRAAVSVASNIAEGAARISKAEKKRFYEIARSSLVEIDTQLEISINLKHYKKGERPQLEQSLGATFGMLSKMITNLTTQPH